MLIELINNRAGLLSLNQRRQKQILCLMYIHKQRFTSARIHEKITRAAGIFSFLSKRYNCVKYKNSSYYTGAILWDGLPNVVKNSLTLLEFKKHLNVVYRRYDDTMMYQP